jgi:serine/threonine-protein kinase
MAAPSPRPAGAPDDDATCPESRPPHRWSRPLEDLSSDAALEGARLVSLDGLARPSVGGRIALTSELGRGGMGVVYHGVHVRLGTEVAVKLLPLPLQSPDDVAVQRFEREAQIAAALRSEHLVGVLDIDRDPALRCHFIVMEYVHGKSAENLLAATPRGMAETDALDVCIGATQGLAVAHLEGVVHRDIKPANVLVPFDERRRPRHAAAKLSDLGLARHEWTGDDPHGLTLENRPMGTPGYMAPEQADDARSARKPADVFGVGATLFALLSGHAPFGGSSTKQRLDNTRAGIRRSLRDLRPDVSAATVALVDRCLDPDPAARYPDASALLEALQVCRAAAAEAGDAGDAATRVLDLAHRPEQGKRVITTPPPPTPAPPSPARTPTPPPPVAAPPRAAPTQPPPVPSSPAPATPQPSAPRPSAPMAPATAAAAAPSAQPATAPAAAPAPAPAATTLQHAGPPAPPPRASAMPIALAILVGAVAIAAAVVMTSRSSTDVGTQVPASPTPPSRGADASGEELRPKEVLRRKPPAPEPAPAPPARIEEPVLEGVHTGPAQTWRNPAGTLSFDAPSGWTVTFDAAGDAAVDPGLRANGQPTAGITAGVSELPAEARSLTPAQLLAQMDTDMGDADSGDVIISRVGPIVSFVAGGLPGAAAEWDIVSDLGRYRIWVGALTRGQHLLSVRATAATGTESRILPGAKRMLVSAKFAAPQRDRVAEDALAGCEFAASTDFSGGAIVTSYEFIGDGTVVRTSISSGSFGAGSVGHDSDVEGTYLVTGNVVRMQFGVETEIAEIERIGPRIVALRIGGKRHGLR